MLALIVELFLLRISFGIVITMPTPMWFLGVYVIANITGHKTLVKLLKWVEVLFPRVLYSSQQKLYIFDTRGVINAI